MTPDSERLLTAPVIFRRPEKRMPKPMAMLPTDLAFLKKLPIISTTPMIRAIGASVEGWRKRRKEVPEASISSRRMI